MRITDLRRALEDIRTHAREGDIDQVLHTADEVLSQLDGERLLTTTQAAELLGIRSVNTLKLLVRRLNVPYEMHGNRMMIPLVAVERIQDNAAVQGIRATDRLHDLSAGFGSEVGVTAQQLIDLERARPGRLPWQPCHGQGESATGM